MDETYTSLGEKSTMSEQYYRSEGRGVNCDADMVRVTIKMPRIEWKQIRKSIVAVLWPFMERDWE